MSVAKSNHAIRILPLVLVFTCYPSCISLLGLAYEAAPLFLSGGKEKAKSKDSKSAIRPFHRETMRGALTFAAIKHVATCICYHNASLLLTTPNHL